MRISFILFVLVNVASRFLLWDRFRLRMTLLCSVDLIFYPLIAFALYHFIGPWYIGYITKGYFGVIFLWGTLIQGVYLPPDFQVFLGTFQVIQIRTRKKKPNSLFYILVVFDYISIDI